MSSIKLLIRALIACLSLSLLFACAPGTADDTPADQVEDKNLTYLYFTDGPDEAATRKLIAQFEQKTGAKVNLEVVPFSNLEQTLQARLTGNNAPDVARVTALGSLRQDLLDLKPLAPELDGPFLEGIKAATAGPAGEILAVPSDLTMNGPIINAALFTKAGVAIPTKDKPWKSWDEMAAAAEQVKKANNTEFGIAMDVSGHRFSTMLSQYGTTFFGADGKTAGLDEAKTAAAITQFAKLNNSGVMPKDLWLQAGSKYKAANDVFLAQQVPVYISGNWQVAAFSKSAQFDWQVVPNPCQERCGGFPGGKFMVSFKKSQRQQLAAQFIAFMNSAESQKVMAADANFLPTRTDLITSGVTYNERAEDMTTFLDEVGKTPQDTYATAFSPAFSLTANATVKEIAAVLSGQSDPAKASANIKAASEKSLTDAG